MSWTSFAVATACKLLLLPTYHSTDFEVHRNWLAITHSLPVTQWYYEETSEWTLDYPPLFAWFELFLSKFACLADPGMVVVDNLEYQSWATICFQRGTVIASDILLFYAAHEVCRLLSPGKANLRPFVLSNLIVFNAGLFLVDHIHFQYNGMLLGLLLLSIARVCQGREVEGAVLYAVLLNAKHLYIAFAPAYLVYLLSAYCVEPGTNRFSFTRFWSLGLSVLGVCAVSLGPFMAAGQITQVFKRMFPFKRGLMHAYWAPNVWALYTAIDKALALMLGSQTGKATMTGGVVGSAAHTVLWSVTPAMTVALTAMAMMPPLYIVWKRGKSTETFLWGCVMCSFAVYQFGWHVHEKAILTVLLPLCVLAVYSPVTYGRLFVLLSLPAHYSLFPLLFQPAETPIKIGITLLYTLLAVYGMKAVGAKRSTYRTVNQLENVYMAGFALLQIYVSVGHHLVFGESMAFLPLLLTSVYCACGIAYVYLWLCCTPPSLQA